MQQEKKLNQTFHLFQCDELLYNFFSSSSSSYYNKFRFQQFLWPFEKKVFFINSKEFFIITLLTLCMSIPSEYIFYGLSSYFSLLFSQERNAINKFSPLILLSVHSLDINIVPSFLFSAWSNERKRNSFSELIH